jgi:plastocyanin
LIARAIVAPIARPVVSFVEDVALPNRPLQRIKRLPRFVLSLAVSLVCLQASVAWAHGPTIEISHSEMKPGLLNLFVGTTVHFSNTVSMPGGHVVVDEGGTLESPPLEKPGDGWHYTFNTPGTYDVHVKQHPKAKARIVVIAKP